MWQYCDEKESLRKGLLRELFLCLRFEGCDGTQHLAAALAKTQNELNGGDAQLQTADTRLLSKNHVNGVLGIFRPKRQVLWRPRRLWPQRVLLFEIPIWALFE